MGKELNKQMTEAIRNGDIDLVKELLANNEGLIDEMWTGTWLYRAAGDGQYEIVKYLIECGIDIDKKDETSVIYNTTALEYAANKGHLDIVELLLENGAKMDVSDWECNPLFSAIYNGHLDVVKCLVENGFDLTPQYELGQYDDVDACKYAWMEGKEEIEEYLKDKMGITGEVERSEKKSKNKWDALGRLMEVYQEGKLESKLDKQHFIELYKEAVKDYFPKLKEDYEDQSIYGLSFKIANTVQKTYADSYGTIIYFNTEEEYQETVEDCDEDEMNYYRFCAWAEWDSESAESELFDKVQEYLWNNSLGFFDEVSADMESELEEEVRDWYEDVELDVEDLHEEEIKNIRLWQAEALGQLRKEGYWEQQGCADIYVIPFEGEDEISTEELVAAYKEMDQGHHGTEYLEYLEEREENA